MKLKQVLRNAKLVMDRKPSIPLLGMVIITIKDGAAVAQACDFNAYYQGSFVVEDIKDGVYSLDQNGIKAVLSGMNIQNVLKPFDSDEMPEYPEMGIEDIKKELATDEFIDALVKSCSVASSEDDRRSWSDAVYAETGKVISTNGKRLMALEVPHTIESALIPALYSKNLQKYKFVKAGMGIGQSGSKKYFVMKDLEQQLAIELIDAKFPEWRRVLPADYKLKFTVKRKKLIKVLKNLESMFRPYDDGIAWKSDITLDINQTVLSLNIITKSDISEIVPVDCVNESGTFRILVNLYYLLDALNCATEDEIEIYHADAKDYSVGKYSLQPILIESDGYKHVVMPIRPFR